MTKATLNILCAGLVVAVTGVSASDVRAQNSNQTGGAIFGAILGGVIGGAVGGNASGRIVSGLVGATVGGLIGSSIGSYLDEQERQKLSAMTRSTAATGKSRRYRGKSGALSTRVTSNSGSCRTVEQEVVLADGTRRTDSVQACKTPQGWKFG